MFDYVIIGAGAAGCVLANRLTEDSGATVALLEAGPRDRKQEIHIPAAFTKLFRTPFDWAYDTAPQPALDGRSLYWPRGKVIGGSTSMNAQMWVRDPVADHGWGDGWLPADTEPSYDRVEQAQRPEELRDPNPMTADFLRACRELDLTPVPTQVTQRRGRRHSAADSFLRPAQRRGNLTVLTDTETTRVCFDGTRAVGVEYRDASGGLHQVEARREVILSAGAVNSPHLLLRSGVGDGARSRALDVPVVAELSEVGRNLQDHLMVAVIRACDEPVSLVAAESIPNVARYLLLRRGMLTSNVGEAYTFTRTRDGLAGPDVELIFAPVPFMDHGLVAPPSHGSTIGPVLQQPKSRGSLTLDPAEPAGAPIIDPGYLNDPDGDDLATMVAGVEWAQRLYDTEAMSRWNGAPIEPAARETDIASFVRRECETLYHPVGTCAIGPVVDAALRVHGVQQLRVVDASVMPTIPRGHTMAPTMMIADRAAELLLQR